MVGHCAVPRSPTPPEACIARGSPLLPVEEAAGPAPLLVRPEARDEPPKPQRVWPYTDENWASDAEEERQQEQRVVPREQRWGATPSRMSRSQRRRARRYNPNRQPTIGDYVSRHPSPPLEEHPGAPCRRERPATPPMREDRPQQRRVERGGVAPRERPAAPQPAAAQPVRLRGVMFGRLRPIPTDPAIDPPAFHCFNCWQNGHDQTRCSRQRLGPSAITAEGTVSTSPYAQGAARRTRRSSRRTTPAKDGSRRSSTAGTARPCVRRKRGVQRCNASS